MDLRIALDIAIDELVGVRENREESLREELNDWVSSITKDTRDEEIAERLRWSGASANSATIEELVDFRDLLAAIETLTRIRDRQEQSPK